MNIALIATTVTLATTLAGSGWWAAKNFATTDQVTVIASKVDYSLDMHIQSLNEQLARLKAKSNKDQDDYKQIEYLRAEIERLRNVRRGQ